MAEITTYRSADYPTWLRHLSEGHLLLSIAHYQELMVESLVTSDPAARRITDVYFELARERRALLMALKDGRPEYCFDYLS